MAYQWNSCAWLSFFYSVGLNAAKHPSYLLIFTSPYLPPVFATGFENGEPIIYTELLGKYLVSDGQGQVTQVAESKRFTLNIFGKISWGTPRRIE